MFRRRSTQFPRKLPAGLSVLPCNRGRDDRARAAGTPLDAACSRWAPGASCALGACRPHRVRDGRARQLLPEPPDLETLYGGLNAQDVSRIGAALKEAGIAFDVNSQGNAVLVRRGQTAQARMLLAEKGLPSSANAGYELFDKLGSMGLTSFMQEITRVRALEGEIARTIQAMKGVKAARVHIVLPDSGLLPPQPPAALGLRHRPHRVRRRLLGGAGHPASGCRRRAGHDRRPGHGA